MKHVICVMMLLSLACGAAPGAEPASKQAKKTTKKAAESAPAPTLADVAYGEHTKHLIHFWKAKSDKPTPLVLWIHGGGWNAGNRMSRLTGAFINDLLDAGISVASAEYRFVPEAYEAGITPPVKWPLHDAARALQFIRSKAGEWHIDKERIAAAGSSAGACTSLWLAFHDDLAEPDSSDPVARESTRLWCAAVLGAQTTLDPKQMVEWTPNSRYGAHAFGIYKEVNGKNVADFATYLERRDEILPWIEEYSPYAMVTPGDSPIYMLYVAPPALGQEQNDPTHTANFGVKLQEKLASAGVPCELVYPGAPDVKHPELQDYLIDVLSKGRK